MHSVPAIEDPPVIPALPAEITDMITDFLFDDKRALASMSLTSRAFLPSSRLHLFNSLTLITDKLWELARAQYSEIVEVLVSIAPFVRHLEIINNEREEDLGNWIRFFLPCLSLLKSITSLSLQLFSWVETDIDARNDLFARFSGLSGLSIINGTFSDSADIVRLALQFPSLERLCFDEIEWVEDSIGDGLVMVVPSDPQALLSLRSFAMGGICLGMESIISWFLSLDRIPALHTFQITTLVLIELESTGLFIRALGPNLRHLTLEFLKDSPNSLSEVEIRKYFDLSHNCGLQSLRLSDLGRFVNFDVFEVGGHIPVLLSQITSLEELFITISGAIVQPQVWIAIDQVLDRPQFSNLRKLNLSFDADHGYDDVTFITGYLPSCAVRGIIRLC